MNKNILILGVVLIVLVLLAYFSFRVTGVGGGKTAEVKGNAIKLEMADTDAKRQKGLSGRDKIADDMGMLFLFDKEDRYSFWMKDMRFPIDIIYLKDDTVVTIYENVQPSTEMQGTKTANLTLYTPDSPANRVLEINAGLAKKYGLKVGDTIKLNL